MDSSEVSSFWEHLEELRQTLIRCLIIIMLGTAISFLFYKELFHLLITPIDSSQTLVLLSPTEGFNTAFKLSFWVGLIGTSPIWLYSLFQFISPALSTRQKKLILPFSLLSFLFGGLGSAFAFFITIPTATIFLTRFNEGLGENLWSLQTYVNFTLMLLFAHALAFEIVVVLLFFIHCGLLSAHMMREKRRHAYLACLIIAAIVTPPDVITQVMLAIPTIGLYELLILYGKMIEKKLALQRNLI